MVWCCDLWFNERDYLVFLENKMVHIHTGPENPLHPDYKPPPVRKLPWADKLEEVFKNIAP